LLPLLPCSFVSPVSATHNFDTQVAPASSFVLVDTTVVLVTSFHPRFLGVTGAAKQLTLLQFSYYIVPGVRTNHGRYVVFLSTSYVVKL
jgi:hypothetical protein